MSVGGRSGAGLLHAPPSATPPGSCARQAKLIPETIWVVEQTTLVHKRVPGETRQDFETFQEMGVFGPSTRLHT